MNRRLLVTLLAASSLQPSLRADTFGSGPNAFSLDFVTVGNAGNANDAGAGGGSVFSPYGGVDYTYRMGTTEISQSHIESATALGMTNVTAGAWSGSQPAASISWYEAASFVNFLNTSAGFQPAYDLTWTGSSYTMNLWDSNQAWQLGGENLFRNKDAYYFLPSEDEWYKAAYHMDNGVTADYWDYATQSNSSPPPVSSGTNAGTAVTDNVTSSPASVTQSGGGSAYGTRGQTGNIREWVESSADGTNSDPSAPRVERGGAYTGFFSNSVGRGTFTPTQESTHIGFRVASKAETITIEEVRWDSTLSVERGGLTDTETNSVTSTTGGVDNHQALVGSADATTFSGSSTATTSASVTVGITATQFSIQSSDSVYNETNSSSLDSTHYRESFTAITFSLTGEFSYVFNSFYAPWIFTGLEAGLEMVGGDSIFHTAVPGYSQFQLSGTLAPGTYVFYVEESGSLTLDGTVFYPPVASAGGSTSSTSTLTLTQTGPSAVPEPTSAVLVGAGFLALTLHRKRRRIAL